jgi:hypothetical protein
MKPNKPLARHSGAGRNPGDLNIAREAGQLSLSASRDIFLLDTGFRRYDEVVCY